jgi:hypothetical protein
MSADFYNWAGVFRDSTFFFSVVVGTFTFLISLSTLLLWREVRALRQLATQQSENIQQSLAVANRSAGMSAAVLMQSQRAFIYLSEWITTLGRDQDGTPLRIDIRPRWENIGVTAATRVDGWCTFAVIDPDTSIDILIPAYGQPRQQLILAPMKSLSATALTIPLSDLATIWSGRSKLIVFARVEYDDVFPGSKRHATENCAELTLNRDPMLIPREGAQASPFVTYRVCGVRNTAD